MKNGALREIIVKPSFRIHTSLIAMHDCSLRMNGGFGFAVSIPNISIRVAKSEVFSINYNGICDIESHFDFLRLLGDELKVKAAVSVPSNFPMHRGLGGGTSLRLAVIEALAILNGQVHDHSELVALSGRGGTSGTGVHTYFNGGFVLDSGRKKNALHTPSSLVKGHSTPLVISCGLMPNWGVKILCPRSLVGLYGKAELEFFESTCPIPDEHAYKCAYLSMFGLTSSCFEADFENFRESVLKVQRGFWKAREISLYPSCYRGLINEINSYDDLVAGLSSMGPAVYIIYKDDKSFEKMKRDVGLKSEDILDAEINNTGREVILD